MDWFRFTHTYTHTYTSKNRTYSFMVTAYFRELGNPLRRCWAVGPMQGGPDDHNFVCVCSRACISFHMGFMTSLCFSFNDMHRSTTCKCIFTHLFVFYATVGRVYFGMYASTHILGCALDVWGACVCIVLAHLCMSLYVLAAFAKEVARLLLTDDK